MPTCEVQGCGNTVHTDGLRLMGDPRFCAGHDPTIQPLVCDCRGMPTPGIGDECKWCRRLIASRVKARR